MVWVSLDLPQHAVRHHRYHFRVKHISLQYELFEVTKSGVHNKP